MKTKFLAPILGAFAFGLSFTVQQVTFGVNDSKSIFISSDKIAFAEAFCSPKPKIYCIEGNRVTYNGEFLSPTNPGKINK